MMKTVITILVLGLYTVSAQDPKVSIKTTQPPSIREVRGQTVIEVMNAKRDQDVTLSCYVEDVRPGMLVRWRKAYEVAPNDIRQVFISTDMAITDNTKYSIEKPTDYTWRLRIKDIQVWDEGKYECYVQLTELSIESRERHVHVLVPPYFTPAMVSPDTTVTKGEDLNLLCNATGIPHPTIEWTRLGGALLPIGKEKHMGGVLSITKIKARDRGPYRCKVWNSIGEITRDILLDVKFEPEVNSVGNTVVSQAPGYSTTLQCYVEANPTPSQGEMKWVKDGLSYTVSTGKYIVRTIEGAFNRLTYEMIIDGVEEEDYGTYTCHISNSMSLNGPTRHNVRLVRSSEPVASPKVGRLVKAGEWQRRFRGLTMNTAPRCMAMSMVLLTICTLSNVLWL